MPLQTPSGTLQKALAQTIQSEMPPHFRNTLYINMEQAFANADGGALSNLVSIIAPLYMEDVLARRDIDRATEFLRRQESTLNSILPFETALWQMQLELLKGNGDAASHALASAVLTRPTYTNSTDYTKQQAAIFKLNATTITPFAIDQTPQTIPETIEAMARNGETNRLCLYIRDILRSRNDTTIASPDDPSLFIGAKSYYRQVLAPYTSVYEHWLTLQIKKLMQQPTRVDDAVRLNLTAHLTPPSPVSGTPTQGQPGLSGPIPNGFTPLIDMVPGSIEVAESHLRSLIRNQPGVEPPASVFIDNGIAWLANSRMLTRLTAGRVAWTWVAPLNRVTRSDDNLERAGNAGPCQPAVSGSTVAFSAHLQSASLAVVGLDRDTGAYRWSWINKPDKVASDPAAWGTNRMVVMQIEPSRRKVNMVILDAITGKETFKLPLSLSRTPGGWARAGSVIFEQDTSWKVPAPSIEGNIAYISSSMGIVASVNLADESIVWMRNYTRFEDPKLIGLRRVRSPVMGKTTTLFAPWDSSSLLLVDKATGKLIATRTDMPWLDVAPCGPNHALILAGATSYILSLNDLKEIRMLTNQNYRVLQILQEGCLLSKPDASVSLIRPDGSITEISPASPSQQILGCDPEGTWYAAGGPGFQWCGVRKQPSAPPSLIRPQRSVESMADFTEGTVVTTNTGITLVRCGQILAALGSKNEPLWELPTPGDENSATALNGRVVLAHSGRLWIHDERTGNLIQTFPEGNSTEVTVLNVFPSADSPGYAIVRDSDPKLGLWPLDANGIIAGKPIARIAESFAATQFKYSTLIVSPSTLSLIELNNPMGYRSAIWTASRTSEPVILSSIPIPPPHFGWRSSDGSKCAVLSAREKLFSVNASGIHERPTTFALGENTMRRLDGNWKSGDLIEARRDDNRTEYLNPMTGIIFKPKTENLHFSAAIGTRVHGLKFSSNGTRNQKDIQPFTFSVDGSSKSTGGPTLPAWLNEVDHKERKIGWLPSAFTRGNESILLLTPPLDYAATYRWEFWANGRSLDMPMPPRNDSIAVIWRGDQFKTVKHLPNVPRNAITWCTPQGVVNIGGTWMSEAQWQTAIQLRETTRTCSSTSGVVTVDGFLNEWPAQEFFATPHGQMALRVSAPDELAIAISITNTTLAERMGTWGLDHLLDISALPENEIFFGEIPSAFPTLDLEQGKVVDHYLRAIQGAAKSTKSTRFAWTVHPDGKSCRIEAIVTGLGLSPSPSTLNPFAIGIRLLWQSNPAEKPVNLVGGPAFGPLSYVYTHFR